MGSAHIPRTAIAVHRALLRLYPAAWQAQFSDDYHATVVERWRYAAARGRLAMLTLIAFALVDALWSGVAARVASAVAAFPRHLQHGMRSLRHAPAFAITAVVTLGIGVGAATAAFTALDAAVFEPLPYPTSDRLAVLAETRNGDEISVSYPDFFDWQRTARSFEAMAAFRGTTVTLTGGATPERASAQVVTSDLFTVLGTTPVIGRAFTIDDDRRGAPRNVILGHALWQRMFGGDRDVVGRAMEISGVQWQIAGVMPEGFRFPDGVVYGPADLYMPTGPEWVDDFDNRDSHPGLSVIGLLARGVPLESARQEMHVIARDLATQYPDSNREIGTLTTDAVTAIIGDLGGRLTGITSAAAVLLLIACANVAGLALTRAVSRRRELLVRLALGESHLSLAGSLLVEHLLLGLAASVTGLAAAFALTGALRPLVASLPRLRDLTPDLTALAFAMGAAAAATSLVGLAPLFWIKRTNIGSLGQRGQTAQGATLRQVLVGAQVALVMMLLATSLLFGVSFRKLASDTGGIRAAGVLSVQIALPEASYPPARRLAFFDTLLDRLESHPSVAAAGAISTLPFSGAGAQSQIARVEDADPAPVRVDVAGIAGNYFEAMGIPILRGRAFAAHDGRTVPVAIVDERFAARFWPNQDPIGRRVRGWGFDEIEIVGVAGHVKNYGAGAESREELYLPNTLRPYTRLYPVIRTTGQPLDVLPDIRRVVQDLDGQIVVGLPRTMTDLVGRTVAAPRLAATLSAAFGTVAFLLAGIGVYSVVAYSVALRKRESAIRMALGARPSNVVVLMMRSIGLALVAGGAIGMGASVAAGRLIESQLFEMPAVDPAVLAATCAATAALGLAAAWLPARRAARTPVAIVLQQD